MNKHNLYEMIAVLYEKQPLAVVLLLLQVLDIVTGLIAAGMHGKVSSKVGFSGMSKKVMTLLLIGMAATFETAQPDMPIVKLTCLFFIVNEGLSILENAKRAGVPIPAVLSNALETMRPNDRAPRGGQEIHMQVANVKIDATVKEEPSPPK